MEPVNDTPAAPAASTRRVQCLAKHLGASAAAASTLAPAPVAASGAAPAPASVHPNLVEERSHAAFDVRQMTHFLDGGKTMTAHKERVMREMETHPVLSVDDREDLTLPQKRERTMEKIRAMLQLFMADSGDIKRRDARLEIATVFDPSWATRNGVHYGLWMGAIMGSGDAEQQAEWLPSTMLMNIFGCFAMTELGHGSFVRGLETTATYDRATEEFVIHTPAITATKWWIGGAGHTATHAAVFAQLIIDGKNHGVHTFVVQLRSLTDHSTMPGITLGDIGKKMGRDGIDNGWIQFNHVRVPRNHMLMKHAQVAPDGTFSRSAKAHMAYGALIGGRASMIKDSSDVLKMALIIAIRYAAVRRQGQPFREGQPEPKLLDFKTHQHRLMPLLAAAYALNFTAAYMRRLQEKLEKGMESDDASALPDVHATSAGLKAFCSWLSHNAIDECRQCCGGHGYSAYTRLCGLHADFAVMCTWEGDNTVMAQQTARYLVSSYERAAKGETISGSVKYLQEFSNATAALRWGARSEGDVESPEHYLTAMRFQACNLVQTVSRKLQKLQEGGMTFAEAWNECQVLLVQASRAHCYFNIASNFLSEIKQAPRDDPAYANLQPTLLQLAALFALSHIQRHQSFFLRSGYMQPQQAELVEARVDALCAAVREQAVPLVDAFNYSDFIIASPLGRYDGDVYTHYLARVKRVPGSQDRAPYYERLIKVQLERGAFDSGDDSSE